MNKVYIIYFCFFCNLFANAEEKISFKEEERIFLVNFASKNPILHIKMKLSRCNQYCNLDFGTAIYYATISRLDEEDLFLCMIQNGIENIKKELPNVKITSISFDLYLSKWIWLDYRDWIKIKSETLSGGIDPVSKELMSANIAFLKTNKKIEKISSVLKTALNSKEIRMVSNEINYQREILGEKWKRLLEDEQLYMKPPCVPCCFSVEY